MTMLQCNIYNRTPKSGTLFTDICIWDIFSRHDFMKHWVEVMFYYYYFYYLWAKIEPKCRYEWLRAKWSEVTEFFSLEARSQGLKALPALNRFQFICFYLLNFKHLFNKFPKISLFLLIIILLMLVILECLSNIVSCLEGTSYLISVFMDFSKAFDCLSQDILLRKMSN